MRDIGGTRCELILTHFPPSDDDKPQIQYLTSSLSSVEHPKREEEGVKRKTFPILSLALNEGAFVQKVLSL